jgi:hypothetical protein
MADQTTVQPPAGGGQPPAGETPTQPATAKATDATTPAVIEAATPAATGNESETISLEEAKKLRSEAANLRKRLKELDANAQAQADAKLGDLEKATKQLTQTTERVTALSAALRQERVGRMTERLATKLNLEPELTAKLLAAETIEYDDDDQPIDLEKKIKALAQRWPQLVKPTTATPGAGNNAADGRGTPLPADAKLREAELKQRYRVQ